MKNYRETLDSARQLSSSEILSRWPTFLFACFMGVIAEQKLEVGDELRNWKFIQTDQGYFGFERNYFSGELIRNRTISIQVIQVDEGKLELRYEKQGDSKKEHLFILDQDLNTIDKIFSRMDHIGISPALMALTAALLFNIFQVS